MGLYYVSIFLPRRHSKRKRTRLQHRKCKMTTRCGHIFTTRILNKRQWQNGYFLTSYIRECPTLCTKECPISYTRECPILYIKEWLHIYLCTKGQHLRRRRHQQKGWYR